jgi:hypothetical protein
LSDIDSWKDTHFSDLFTQTDMAIEKTFNLIGERVNVIFVIGKHSVQRGYRAALSHAGSLD